MASDTRSVYLYALIRADAADVARLIGVADSDGIRLISGGDLSLVVSDVSTAELEVPDEELSEKGRLAEMAVAHDTVIRGLFEQGPVLPLRLATVVADDDAARQVLNDCAERALERLGRLENHKEWAVRLHRTGTTPSVNAVGGDSSRLDRSNAAQTDGGARPSGTAYLQRRRDELRAAAESRSRDDALKDDTHAALAGHATAATRRPVGQADQILNAAFLVHAEREDAFLAESDLQAASLAAAGVSLDVIGPWPPYSFAALGTTQEASHA